MKTLPIIDINGQNLGEELYSAFSEVGFAALRLSPEDDARLLGLTQLGYDVAENFFNLSKEEKEKWIVEGSFGQRGFTPFQTEKAKDQTVPDLKEFLQFGGRDNVGPIGVKALYGDLFSHLQFLAEFLMEELADHIDMSEEDLQATLDGQTILRVIHYPPTGEMKGMRSAPHEDINLLTLLPAASAAGLQVLSKDGTWIDAPTESDMLIINVGDMLQEYTRGKLKSTTHRVVNTEEGKTRSRFSMPFFYHPPGDFFLSEKYPKASIYLDERLKEIGLK